MTNWPVLQLCLAQPTKSKIIIFLSRFGRTIQNRTSRFARRGRKSNSIDMCPTLGLSQPDGILETKWPIREPGWSCEFDFDSKKLESLIIWKVLITRFSFQITLEPDGNLRINHLYKEDEGKYQCIASNMAASRESSVIQLQVLREC